MDTGPRHCVYCRAQKRECEVEETKVYEVDFEGYQVRCKTCGARGPVNPERERAVTSWNIHTAFVEQAFIDVEHVKALVDISKQWKARAMTSAELASDLGKILNDVRAMVGKEAEIVVARHKTPAWKKGEEVIDGG